MVIFYLAINNEPDYMPMNQKKAAAAAEMSESPANGEVQHSEHQQHNHQSILVEDDKSVLNRDLSSYSRY